MADRIADGDGIPDLSVVVVNWNTRDELRACLRSVAEAGPGADIVVVDNASSDGSAGMVAREFPGVRLIENSENLGFAKAANQGIAAGHGRYVMLLNPDGEVRPGALSSLVRFGDENPGVGIFGPKILNPDGSLQYSCRRFPTPQAGLFRSTPLGRLFPNNRYTRDYLMSEWDHSEPRDVDWVSGAALVIRREALNEIGLLDERFYMYCEDVDIACRAREKGWRVAYFPEAVVIHACARSSDQNPDRMIIEFHKSMYRFFRKHYKRDLSLLMRILVPVGLIARACFFLIHGRAIRILYNLKYRLRLVRQSGDAKVAEEGSKRGGSNEA